MGWCEGEMIEGERVGWCEVRWWDGVRVRGGMV